MDLKYYLAILWRRKWVVIAILVSALAAVAIGNYFSTPMYTATATLRIDVSIGARQNPNLYNYKDDLMNTYVQIATSRPILAELTKRLKTNKTLNVKSEIIPSTELILITATDQSPQVSARAANTLAAILIEQSNQLYAGGAVNSQDILAGQVEQSRTELDVMRKEYEKLVVQTPAAPGKITLIGQFLQEKQRTYEILLRQYEQAQYLGALETSMISFVEQAVVPQTPSQPRVMLNYSIAVIIALMAGIILAFLFENMDDRMHVTHEIEAAAQIPVLAKLPKTGNNHLYISKNGTSPLAESIRHLSMRLQTMGQKPQHDVLLLAGAEPGQGATTTVANLGSALAEQGKSVVVVDFNLRDPKLHELFDLPNEWGVTDVLSGSLNLKQVIQKVGTSHLSLLASGSLSAPLSKPFDSAQIETLINALRQQYEYVVVDAPDIKFADIANIAPYADKLILVTRRSHVNLESIQSAREFLSRYNGKFIGMIVNETEGQFVRA